MQFPVDEQRTMGLFDGTPLERPVLCDHCGRDVKVCGCEPTQAAVDNEPNVPPSAQSLKVRVEKRKRGKSVTVVAGLRGSSQQRKELLSALKNLCGAGGTLQDEALEIQGDHRQRVVEELRRRSFRVA